MSLFPAYGGSIRSNQNETSSEASNENLDWLSLQSYSKSGVTEETYAGDKDLTIRVTDEININSDSMCHSNDGISRKRLKTEENETEPHKKHKKKKKKKGHKRTEESCGDEKPKPWDESAIGMEVSSDCMQSSAITQLPVNDKVFVNDVLSLIKTPYAFCVDRKPDKDNITYGCIYRPKIARYRLFGNSKTSSKSGKGKNKSEVDGGRYFSSKGRKFTELHEKILMPNTSKEVLSSDYVALLEEKSCVNDSSVDTPVEVLDDKALLIRKKVEEYNRLLNADPHDENLWLEFVDFQKSALCLKRAENRSKDDVEQWLNADRRTLVEIRSAILEKAVEKNPSSKVLRLAQLELMGSTWEVEKLSQEWKKLVFSFASDANVWRHYLGFVKSNFGTFTVSRVAGVYAKCLTTLDSVRCGTMTSHKELPNTVEDMIDIFQDLGVFLYQSGHAERALALFQAQMEYNLFCPSILLDVAAADRLDFLSAFWDSGVPRFGEVGARGWADWVTNKGVYSPGSLSANAWSSKDKDEKKEEDLINTDDDKHKLWLVFENSRLSRHWMPWKQLLGSLEDEDECEDSERVVLFEDIPKCLFFLTSEEHRFALFSRFFDFLATLCGSKSAAQNFSNLNVMESASEIFSRSDAKLLFSPLSSGTELENYAAFRTNVLEQIGDKFDGNYRTYVYLSEIDFRLSRIPYHGDSAITVDKKDLKKFLKTLLSGERNNLAIWQRYAASEFQGGNLKDARKVFDTAISTCRDGLVPDFLNYEACVTVLLYRTYASLELGLKTLGLWADNVGLRVSRKLVEKKPVGAENTARAVSILVALCEGSNKPAFDSAMQPTRLLKCQRLYTQSLNTLFEQFTAIVAEQNVSGLQLQLRYVGSTLVHWFACFSIFQYLVNGFEAAATSSEAFLSKISSGIVGEKTVPSVYHYRKSVHRLCLEAYTGLHCFHVSNNISPLSPLRVSLVSSLRQFPESQLLLDLFVDLESTSSIAGRLRKFFHESIGCAASPLIPLFAVLSEFKRFRSLRLHQADLLHQGLVVMETGITNQLRAWFEVAVNQQKSQRCILLWRLYMFFEEQLNKHNNVKAVFYRALQQCPWAKTIYLDCVRYVPEMLQEVNDLMTEKELRIRTPLEELSLLLLGKSAQIAESGEQQDSLQQADDL